jgi:hypothetical protein
LEIAIRDTLKFMQTIVQTKKTVTRADLRVALNAKLMQVLKPTLARLIRQNGVSVRDLVFSQDVIAQATKEKFAEEIFQYGIELLTFNVESVRLTDDTAKKVESLDSKAMDVGKEALERDVLGLSRKEERQLDIAETIASNQGAGLTMAPMMGLGLGLGTAAPMAKGVANMMGNIMPDAGGVRNPGSVPPPCADSNSISPPPLPSSLEKKFSIVIDGSQYGPYTLNMLRQWHQEGRIKLTPDSLVWSPGMTEWKPCSQCAEISIFFDSGENPVIPPPLPKK